jgi:hypothetical protein
MVGELELMADAKTNNVVPLRSAMPRTKLEMLTPSEMQALRKRRKRTAPTFKSPSPT